MSKTSINKNESELDKMKRESLEWIDRYGKTAPPFISVAINAFSQLPTVTDEQRLKILEEVKLHFDIYSDHSTHCLGYRNLTQKIKGLRALIPASDNTVKEEGMTDLRTLMLLISSRIDQGYDMSNSDLKALWNSLSDIVTKFNDISSAPDTKIEKGKEEFKTPQWFLDRKKKRTKKYNG
jgi:hypothetical protein